MILNKIKIKLYNCATMSCASHDPILRKLFMMLLYVIILLALLLFANIQHLSSTCIAVTADFFP